TLTSLCRSVIDQTTSPIVAKMFRLVGPVADRRPDLSQVFFQRGPLRTMAMIGDYLRDNFADQFEIADYEDAGRDLVLLASGYLPVTCTSCRWGASRSPRPPRKRTPARATPPSCSSVPMRRIPRRCLPAKARSAPCIARCGV